MNIIFEGIDASGKTTLIKSFIEHSYNNGLNIEYVKEIEDSPLNNILKDLLNSDPFFRDSKKFKTSIYETFLLASAFFYKQEALRNNSKEIYIYDRDIYTLLCSQKIILNAEYGDSINDFYSNLTKCLLFDLKKIDLLVYISVPITISLERIKTRDNLVLSQDEQDFLIKVKNCFENTYLPSINQEKTPILFLNGEAPLAENISLLNKKLKCIN